MAFVWFVAYVVCVDCLFYALQRGGLARMAVFS
jgi:hypothetical protein